jgi:hypothetical protein
VPDFFLFKGLFADFSCIAAILPNDLAPTNVNGPLLPFITTSKCCGAARQSGHSLQLQNLRGANSQTADKVNFRCGCACIRYWQFVRCYTPLAFISFRHYHNELSKMAAEF